MWLRTNHSSGFDLVVIVFFPPSLIFSQHSAQGGQPFIFDRQGVSRHNQPTPRQRRTDLHLGFGALPSRDRSKYVCLLISLAMLPLTHDLRVKQTEVEASVREFG